MRRLSIFLALALAVPAFAQTNQRTLGVRIRAAATTGTTYIQWTWNAPTGTVLAQGYNVYQATGTCGSTGQTFSQVVTGTTLTSWQQTTLPATVSCTYVTAVSAVGVEGPPSNSFQLDLTAPAAPTALAGTYTQGK